MYSKKFYYHFYKKRSFNCDKTYIKKINNKNSIHNNDNIHKTRFQLISSKDIGSSQISQQNNSKLQQIESGMQQTTTSFNKLKDACSKIPQGFSLFRNEQANKFSFDMIEDVDVKKIIISKKQNLHLHEIVNEYSKIFFDIDLKIPTTIVDNDVINQFLKQQQYLKNLRDKSIDDIVEQLKIKHKQGPLLERFIIYSIEKIIAKHFSDKFLEIEEENWISSNVTDIVFLDTLFDQFRSSRNLQNGQTKISWHLVFLPDMYYIKISQLKTISQQINIQIDKYFKEIQTLLNPQLQQRNIDVLMVQDCVDIQVYKKNGSIRFANCLKFQNKDGRKKYIQMNDNTFKNQQFMSQLPSRFLVSRLQTQEGNPLKLIQIDKQNDETNEYICNDNLKQIEFQNCPLSELQIQKILFKQNIFNAVIDNPQQQGDIFHIRIKNHLKTCVLCNRIHESDNMYLIINQRLQFVEIRCFRKKGSRGIKVDFEGQQYMTEFDANNLQQNAPQIIQTEDVNSEQLISQSGKIKQIKQEELVKINELYQKKFETIDFKQFNIEHIKQHQSEIQTFPEEFHKLYIKSHMGTSKTKRLMQYISQYMLKNPQSKICILSFRIIFAEDLTIKLNNYLKSVNINNKFVSYLQLQKHKNIDQQYLIIQIESLNKICMNTTKYDLLILDESESIFEQLTSGLSQKESINFSIFTQLIKQSKQIVCMDAFLSQRSIYLIESFTQTSDSQQKSYFIHNTWQMQKDYILYQSNKKKDLWLHDLITSYKKGDNIVVPCNNATVAEAVYKLITEIIPEEDKRYIQVFTQKLNKEQKEKDLIDLQESWKQYRVLIYSPTISAGISYEMKHFNRIFAYFDIKSTNMETFFQMMGRVRNISSNTYHILLTGQPIQNPCFIQQIHNQILQQIQDSCQQIPLGIFFKCNNELITIENNDYYQLILHNSRVKNLTTSLATQRFLYLVGNNSNIYTKVPLQEIQFEYRLDNLVKNLKQWKFEQMRDSQLQPQLNRQIHSQFEQDKYYISKQMGLSQDNIHYLENMTNRNQMEQWVKKYRYLMFRLQYGQLTEFVQFQKSQLQQKQVIQYEKMNIIRELIENSKERFPEILLQILGMNQDLLNIQYCKKHQEHLKEDCSCNKQHYKNVEFNILVFINNIKQINHFCKYLKHIQTVDNEKIRKILIQLNRNVKYNKDIQKQIHLCIKLIKGLLQRNFGIKVVKIYNDFYKLQHTNDFEQFLYKYIQNHQFLIKNDKYMNQKIIMQLFINNKTIISLFKQKSVFNQMQTQIYPLLDTTSKTHNWTVKEIKSLYKQLETIQTKQDLIYVLGYYKEQSEYQDLLQILYLISNIFSNKQEDTLDYFPLLQDYNYNNEENGLIQNIQTSIYKIKQDMCDQDDKVLIQ